MTQSMAHASEGQRECPQAAGQGAEGAILRAHSYRVGTVSRSARLQTPGLPATPGEVPRSQGLPSCTCPAESASLSLTQAAGPHSLGVALPRSDCASSLHVGPGFHTGQGVHSQGQVSNHDAVRLQRQEQQNPMPPTTGFTTRRPHGTLTSPSTGATRFPLA